MKKRRPMLWVIKRIRRRIPALIIMTATNILVSILGVSFALGTKEVIDSAAAMRAHEFYAACGVLIAIIVGILSLSVFFRHMKDKILADLDRDWKRDLLHRLLNGEFQKVSAFHTGELINRLGNDVRKVDEGVTGLLPGVAAMLTQLVAAMVVLISMEPWFAVLIVAAGVMVVFLTSLMRRMLKDLHKRVSECEGRVSGFIQETLEKLLMVQAMDVSEEMERRTDVLLNERYNMQRKRKNVSLLAGTGISIMSYAASFLALVWCAYGILKGRMSFGELTAVTQLVGQLQGPFTNLSSIIPQYVGIVAAAERLMELEEVCGDVLIVADDGQELYRKLSGITAKNLTFAYDREPVFSNANFVLNKGEFAVVTGASGIGKSTLIKLMLGIFRPAEGGLYIKGNDGEREIDRSTRRLFAYVPQGNLLLSGTLRENLTITRPEATEEEINHAIYISCMEELVSRLPDGLDTVLGESGAGLSHGEAQRLAIARAVLGGAPVLLLDEITSALDIDTERTVLNRIKQLEGRTCIAVTHRAAALEIADVKLEVSGNGVFRKELQMR